MKAYAWVTFIVLLGLFILGALVITNAARGLPLLPKIPTPFVGSWTGMTTNPSSSSTVIVTGGSDNFNCGALGRYCDPALGLQCKSGQCVCAQTGFTFCPNFGCVDLNTFAGACGSCSNPGCLASTSKCCSGACTLINTVKNCGGCGNTCTGGNPGCCGGGCVDLNTNFVHCGSCFNTVPQTGFRCCTGIVTAINDQNCSSCGQQCPPGYKCDPNAQTCIPGCPAGQTLCNGVCKDLTQDNFNCGFCGTPCPMGTYCFAGQCIDNSCSDPDAFFNNGQCISLSTNTNCGQIGNQCPTFCTANKTCNCTSTLQCPQGWFCALETNECVPPSCPSGQTYCTAIQACVNLNQGDAQGRGMSCGACGINCPSGQCVNGQCVCATSADCLLGYDCITGRCVLH